MKYGVKPGGWAPTKTKKQQPRISQRSKSGIKRSREYAKVREEVVTGVCACCVRNEASEVHHMRGRAGSLLTDKRHLVAVCNECHRWIHENPNEARKAGWLCRPGLWNKPDRR